MTIAAITRLLLYLGAMIVVGDAARSVACVVSAANERSDEEMARSFVVTGWALLCIATIALMLLQARDMELEPTMDALSLLLSTTWGHGWLMLALAALVGAAATLMRFPQTLRILAAVAVAVTMGGLGHAAADDVFPLLSRITDSLHVLAAGAWLGGLALVAAIQLRAAPASVRGYRECGQEWQAFSRIATVAAPLVLLTGLIAGWRRLQLAPLSEGATSPVSYATAAASNYGLLLGAKLALVLVTLALGYTHRRRVLREHAPSWTTVFTELALAVAVLAVTGVLTGTAPPGE